METTKQIKLRKQNQIQLKEKWAIMTIDSPTWGKVKVYVDLEDVDKISSIRWDIAFTGFKFYVVGNRINEQGKRVTVYLHRFVTNAVNVVDHISGDPFDNRKKNLRTSEDATEARKINRKNLKQTTRYKKFVDKVFVDIIWNELLFQPS